MSNFTREALKAVLPKEARTFARTARRLYTETSDVFVTECRWLFFNNRSRASKTAADIIVSLTSYPPRFGTLALTLKTLLMQSYLDYRLTLWIAEDDYRFLPRQVHELTRSGLDIMTCPDLGVFKKILPAMKRFPGHLIVSADDDFLYWPSWLEDLVSQYSLAKNEVLCHRMHEIRLNEDGTPLPYCEWLWESQSLEPHPLNFATSGGGVLYPPHVFPEEAFDEHEIFSRCPTADDIWYYWMARRNGAIVRKVPSRGIPIQWGGSQAVALSRQNVEGGQNDRIIQNMITAYGLPF